MTETKYIKRLEKMVADRKELLQVTLDSDLRENVNALRSRDKEIQDLKRKCAHERAVAKSREDEVNKMRYEISKLRTELEKSQEAETVLCGRTVATFKTDDIRGLIDRRERGKTMKIKKLIISAVASILLVAALTGCIR